MSGIACASDSDFSIYQLAKSEPVAVAISKSSPLPWDDIITAYRLKGEPTHHADFSEYAKDFAAHLNSQVQGKVYKGMTNDDTRILFMGYGTEDLYPCIYDTKVSQTENGVLLLQDSKVERVTHEVSAIWKSIGDFGCLTVLFDGATEQMKQCMREANTTKLASLNIDSAPIIEKAIQRGNDKFNDRVVTGLASFSVEEMVSTCESLVNANLRMNHLMSGGNGLVGNTREIAAILRTEGVTWIKHSLFAV